MDKYIKEIDNWDKYQNHTKNNKFFILKKEIDELSLVYYKIVYKIPANKNYCFKTLIDPNMRIHLSNNSMKYNIIGDKHTNNDLQLWYEKINYSDDLYSIEKINSIQNKNLIFSYSHDHPNFKDNGSILNKRENIFSGIKIYDDDESNDKNNNSVIVVLLTFGMFEMISENIIDGTIGFLQNLEKNC